MNRRSLFEITCVLLTYSVLACSSQLAFEGAKGSMILNAVRVGSYMVIIMAVCLAFSSLWKGKIHLDSPVKHERMSLRNIITHAYLMGAFIFVTVYCLLGESRDATKAYLLSHAVVSFEDSFSRTTDSMLRRSLLFFVALLCGVSVATIQGPSELELSFHEMRWFAIVFGWILPSVVPVFFVAIRKKRYYSPVTVYEFLHFGMPFAVMLATLSLVSIDLISHDYDLPAPAADRHHARRKSLRSAFNESFPLLQRPPPNASLMDWVPHVTHAAVANATANATLQDVHKMARLVTNPDVVIPLFSVLMIFIVGMVIDRCLLYSTVDTLSCVSIAWAFKTLHENSGLPSALTVVSFVSAAVGFSFRIYVCSLDKDDYAGVAYTKEHADDEEEEQMMKGLQADLESRTANA